LDEVDHRHYNFYVVDIPSMLISGCSLLTAC